MKRSVALLIVLAACGRMERAAPPSSGGGSSTIARTARVRLSAADTRETSRALEQLVGQLGGSVASLQLEGDGSAPVEASLRVPAPQLESFLDRLHGLGAVQSESRTAEDVGAPLADLGARLDSARALERELQRLLERPSSTLADLVAVEGKLAEVREKIEQLEGQQRALRARVELVQVDVSIVHAALEGPYLGQLGEVLRGSFGALEKAARLGGLAAAALAPWLAALALVLAIAKVISGARRAR